MRAIKGLSVLILALSVFFLNGQVSAQTSKGAAPVVYGPGEPGSLFSLPAGKLRDRLQNLPPQARSKALRSLQDFSFPLADLDTLKIDHAGNVFYADTIVPAADIHQSYQNEGLSTQNTPSATLDDAFALHSRPGASNVVFLDFDGALISGTFWNSSVTEYVALPYNPEGDPYTFTAEERASIVNIWHRVAEDLAPYNIDVTTEDPGSFNPTTGHVLITYTEDANGIPMPSNSGGGVAYVNVFGSSYYHTKASPALVYWNRLGGGTSTYVAEASSHEFGHNLGLSHDGNTNAAGSAGTYYSGHGVGLVSWAPIMGNSYYKNVTEWSKGEYDGANQHQDDLLIISNKLGLAPDDHGNTQGTASPLSVNAFGQVVSSNPEMDPHNLLPENKGVIDSASDVDVFSFTAANGAVNLTITPAWDAFYAGSSRRGANLDIQAELRDLGGAQIAMSDAGNDTATTINTTVSAGSYFLYITGVGNVMTPYSDYNSQGQYFINGSLSPGEYVTAPVADFTYTTAGLTATFTDRSSDGDGNVTAWSWSFGDGINSSSENPTHTYAASGAYTVMLMVTDNDGATDSMSQSVTVTAAVDTQNPSMPALLMVDEVSESTIDISWGASTDNVAVTGYDVYRDGASHASVSGRSYSDSGLAPGTTHGYQVRAFDAAGNRSDLTQTVFGSTDTATVDVITLIDAVYKADRGEFKVRATSSRQPDVTLQVAGFGPMTFKRGKYEYKLRPVGSINIPSTVEIISSLGASLTVPVVGAQPPQVPGQASAPNPANGQGSVSTTPSLNWTAGAGTDTHKVYFGTSSNPPFAGSQTATGYNPGTLANETTYYWRIDETNELGTTVGTIWSFTTQATTPTSTDNIVITKAEWKASKSELKVEGTSSGAPAAVLTVDGYGQMTYDSRKNKYKATFKPVTSNPGSVTVTSSLGGSATKAVRLR